MLTSLLRVFLLCEKMANPSRSFAATWRQFYDTWNNITYLKDRSLRQKNESKPKADNDDEHTSWLVVVAIRYYIYKQYCSTSTCKEICQV
jgi:hypothetical protein